MAKGEQAMRTGQSHQSRAKERQHRPSQCNQVSEPFRFLDLPTELRHIILNHAVPCPELDRRTVLSLFLTCHAIYEQAASIVYHKVVIDTRETGEVPNAFLQRAITPRLHIRDLTIRFYVIDQLCIFQDVYAPILRTMAEEGDLRHLRLELSYCFPSPRYWGGKRADIYYDNVPLLRRNSKDETTFAPLIVAGAPFQDFLALLSDKRFPKVTLYIGAEDHAPFWCAFHKRPPSGICDGCWEWGADLLEIKWETLVKKLWGVKPADPVGATLLLRQTPFLVDKHLPPD